MKALVLTLALLPFAVFAQSHSDHMMHSGQGMSAALQGPSEAGQGGFAALAEITAILRADPSTDWSKVDLGRLRAHLQDMNTLVNVLEVRQAQVDGGLQMTVDLDAPGADAARRMVPAHAPVLAVESGWASDASVGEAQIVWTVTDAENEGQIRALGFFGLMAIGNHHPTHHLAIAKGADPHSHH